MDKSVADEIAKLAALKDAGHLTDAEFQAQKAAILALSGSPNQGPPARTKGPEPRQSTNVGCFTIFGWVVAGIIALGILGAIFGGKGSGSSTVDATPKPSAWQPPEGYQLAETDNGVAFGIRWLKSKEYSCDLGDRCWGAEIVTSRDCPSQFYAQITLLNKQNVDVGWTNDTAHAVHAGDKVQLVFHTYEARARSARLGNTACQ